MKKIIFIILILSCFSFWFQPMKSDEVRDYPLIVLAVKFSDQPNLHDFSWVQNQLFGDGNQSVNDFFWQCSTGKTRVVQGKFEGLQWTQADKPLTYYAEDTKTAFDIRARELVTESITKAIENGLKPEDYEFYDPNWDIVYSQACIIVTGDQEGYQNFPRSDAFWPHASAIEIKHGDKTYIFRYFLACEGLEKSSVDLNLAWTATHEYGHVMGLWDLYDYGCGGPFGGNCTFPVTYFDIMVARHKGLGMLGYQRERLGFIEPLVVEKSGEYTLKPITTNDPNCYLNIPIPGTREYIGVEYRKRTGIDSFWNSIPSEGVLIYKVSDDPRYGAENGNNGDDGYYLLDLFNPGKTKWHENACYSIESGQTTASGKTVPSTMPYNPNYKGIVKVEVISKLGDEVKVRVTITPREKLTISLNTNRVFVGRLHRTKFNCLLLNGSKDTITVKGLNCEIEESVTLDVNKPVRVNMSVDLTPEKIPKTFEEREIGFESDAMYHKTKVIMINIAYILDSDKDGTISQDEVSMVARAVGRPKKPDQDFDFDGNGKVDIQDLMIASRYVGYKVE
jgi:M6 family metalloprotease-like protein